MLNYVKNIMTSYEDIQIASENNDNTKNQQNENIGNAPTGEGNVEDSNWKSFLATGEQDRQIPTDNNIKITDDNRSGAETAKNEEIQPERKSSKSLPKETEPQQVEQLPPISEPSNIKPEEGHPLVDVPLTTGHEEMRSEEKGESQEKATSPKGSKKKKPTMSEQHPETTDIEEGKKRKGRGKGRKHKEPAGEDIKESEEPNIAEHTRKHRSVDKKEFEKYESLLNKKTTRKRKTK
jgi:hypothetical protein